eukprot:scaffold5077_cov54-Phaeocystis_antarctica.AAC.2
MFLRAGVGSGELLAHEFDLGLAAHCDGTELRDERAAAAEGLAIDLDQLVLHLKLAVGLRAGCDRDHLVLAVDGDPLPSRCARARPSSSASWVASWWGARPPSTAKAGADAEDDEESGAATDEAHGHRAELYTGHRHHGAVLGRCRLVTAALAPTATRVAGDRLLHRLDSHSEACRGGRRGERAQCGHERGRIRRAVCIDRCGDTNARGGNHQRDGRARCPQQRGQALCEGIAVECVDGAAHDKGKAHHMLRLHPRARRRGRPPGRGRCRHRRVGGRRRRGRRDPSAEGAVGR